MKKINKMAISTMAAAIVSICAIIVECHANIKETQSSETTPAVVAGSEGNGKV